MRSLQGNRSDSTVDTLNVVTVYFFHGDKLKTLSFSFNFNINATVIVTLLRQAVIYIARSKVIRNEIL